MSYQLFWLNTDLEVLFMKRKLSLILISILIAVQISPVFSLAATLAAKHSVPREHPRLLGSIDYLRRLSQERADAYERVRNVARVAKAGDYEKMLSMALVSAIDDDPSLGREAVALAIKFIEGPIRSGHATFGYDLAYCALVYDLCYPHWTPAERTAYIDYMNKTVDANVNSETHVFHNAWYGYKHWGYGLACYATYYENDRAVSILNDLETDYTTRAAPALQLAGFGGGWAEGYYIHYWLYEWLFFCEVALTCEGKDYYSLAPDFYKNRAVAGMFEMYPGLKEYNSRRPIPMGDGGGRRFGGDRDKALSARRILANHYRDDPTHRIVNTFNEATPQSSVSVYAYKDFLWRDTSVAKGNLDSFRLSHISTGPGFVYARSTWQDDATYFFFKCGDRFTAHQHLDNGQFLIYKYDELAGDGGQYYAFGVNHDVNYHLRTIAHNTILIYDPDETWPSIRAGTVTGNDGGQAHDWPHHNGAATDPNEWIGNKNLYDIADIIAYEDTGAYVYVAGDCTKSYNPRKIEYFTRQIVFIRPNTFVIFDRVKSKNPSFTKTWLLQAMASPQGETPNFVITNGNGRLFVQTLLPRNPQVTLNSGDELYRYDNKSFPPKETRGKAPECRIEISPAEAQTMDYFLHILTAADASVGSAPDAKLVTSDAEITALVESVSVTFTKDSVGGNIIIGGEDRILGNTIRGIK